jgi:hypothetical protein
MNEASQVTPARKPTTTCSRDMPDNSIQNGNMIVLPELYLVETCWKLTTHGGPPNHQNDSWTAGVPWRDDEPLLESGRHFVELGVGVGSDRLNSGQTHNDNQGQHYGVFDSSWAVFADKKLLYCLQHGGLTPN